MSNETKDRWRATDEAIFKMKSLKEDIDSGMYTMTNEELSESMNQSVELSDAFTDGQLYDICNNAVKKLISLSADILRAQVFRGAPIICFVDQFINESIYDPTTKFIISPTTSLKLLKYMSLAGLELTKGYDSDSSESRLVFQIIDLYQLSQNLSNDLCHLVREEDHSNENT